MVNFYTCTHSVHVHGIVMLPGTSFKEKVCLDVWWYSLPQIQVQRIAPSIVQQFQSRCSACGGKGEIIRGEYMGNLKKYTCTCM